jgi:hypothetical protein
LHKDWDVTKEGAVLRLVELFGRTRNDEHDGLGLARPGLSSALTTVTDCESSALGIGELDAPEALLRSASRILVDAVLRSVATSCSKRESNSHCCAIGQEIADIKSQWDSDSLTAPLRAVQHDPQYRAARQAIVDRVRELQSRIAPS